MSVHDWLEMLKLDDLWPLFEARGYTDMNRISSRGLKQDDLDKIGVRITHAYLYIHTCLSIVLNAVSLFCVHAHSCVSCSSQVAVATV
jgi:SAM domain (Sterile alpha motif)